MCAQGSKAIQDHTESNKRSGHGTFLLQTPTGTGTGTDTATRADCWLALVLVGKGQAAGQWASIGESWAVGGEQVPLGAMFGSVLEASTIEIWHLGREHGKILDVPVGEGEKRNYLCLR